MLNSRLVVAVTSMIVCAALAGPSLAAPVPAPAPDPTLAKSVLLAVNAHLLPRAPFGGQADFLIARDGHWRMGDEHGALTADDLTLVRQSVARTRLVLAKATATRCSEPRTPIRIRTTRGTLLSAGACRPPSPEVLALLALANAAIARSHDAVPPVASKTRLLAAYEEMRFDGPHDRTQITVMEDGSWRAGGRSGFLGRGQFAELHELVAQARKASAKPAVRPGECAARLDGEASLALGAGPNFRWSLPCGQPQGAVGDLVRRLVEFARPRPNAPRE